MKLREGVLRALAAVIGDGFPKERLDMFVEPWLPPTPYGIDGHTRLALEITAIREVRGLDHGGVRAKQRRMVPMVKLNNSWNVPCRVGSRGTRSASLTP